VVVVVVAAVVVVVVVVVVAVAVAAAAVVVVVVVVGFGLLDEWRLGRPSYVYIVKSILWDVGRAVAQAVSR
jgi:hypothetical protein